MLVNQNFYMFRLFRFPWQKWVIKRLMVSIVGRYRILTLESVELFSF